MEHLKEEGFDLYKELAAQVLNKRVSQVTNEERINIKIAALGIAYREAPKHLD